MTTYNTGNSVGSADPRDLYDNAQVIDDYANSAGDTTSDRLGASRRTLAGMEGEFDADQAERIQRFNTFIRASGYEFLGDYAAGIEVTEYNQIIRDTAGEFWRASGTTELPYTTDGTGMPEGGAFRPVGDAALRQELDGALGSGLGGLLVRGSVIYVDTIADLQALPVGDLVDGQQVQVSGYYSPNDGGGGPSRVWNTGAAGEYEDNGGSIIVPTGGDGSGAWLWEWSGAVNVKWFGAKGDGSTNDTSAVQNTVDYSRNIYIPNTGTSYKIKAEDGTGGRLGVILPSDTTLIFEPGAEFEAIPNDSINYSIINLRNAPSNITLINPTLTGDKYTHTGTTGEFGMGVDARSVDGLYIENAKITKCWGDGIYLGENNTGPCKNVILDNVLCDDNRRQGISVISIQGLYGRNVTLSNTGGTKPEAGIDFEPNKDFNVLQNIEFDNLVTRNNAGGGILFFLSNIGPGNNVGADPTEISAVFNNYRSEGDEGFTAAFSRYQGRGLGSIVFNSPASIDNSRAGFLQRIWDAEGPQVVLNNPVVRNPNRSGLTNTLFSAPFSINTGSDETSSTINTGNMVINSPKVYRDPALTHAHTTNLITRDLQGGKVTGLHLAGELPSPFQVDNTQNHEYITSYTVSGESLYPTAVIGRQLVMDDRGANTGFDKFYQASWAKNNVETGTEVVFDTGIPVSDRRSRVVTISSKRSGTLRMDTYIRIHNKNGAAGTDADFPVATDTNQGGTANVVLSTSASNTLVLTLDVTLTLDQLSVSANG